MGDVYYETFYLWIFIVFWLIVPAIMGIGFFIFFARMSNARMHLQKSIDDTKWQVKWKHKWDGTPYVKDAGWGTGYSKLSEEEYFAKLNRERAKEDGKVKFPLTNLKSQHKITPRN